ncbi:MAG: hypothetical protein AAF696_29550, partial [Bacteroidota bacterium]
MRKQDSSVQRAMDYLGNCRIYMDLKGHEEFSIHKIFHLFYDEKLKPNKKPLKGTSLRRYGRSVRRYLEDVTLDFPPDPYNLDIPCFKYAENMVVASLLHSMNQAKSIFLPIPILGYGELVGTAYFIYDKSKIQGNVKRITDIVRFMTVTITRAYESVQLMGQLNKFGPKPNDIVEPYRKLFAKLGIQKYFKEANNGESFHFNPFLQGLGYEAHYKHLAKVIDREIEMVYRAQKARIKSAIVSIIVDSFAHNTGAHSLIALKWWFENRYKIMDKCFPLIQENKAGELERVEIVNNVKTIPFNQLKSYGEKKQFYGEIIRSESALRNEDFSLTDLIFFLPQKELQELFSFYQRPEGSLKQAFLSHFPVPVDFALMHFFEFLRNKSAFWSGVSRDTLFGGRIRSWFHILRKFVNNSLFLGTVAHSEGVNRVNIHVEILDENSKIVVGGEFARINLEIIQKEKFSGIPSGNGHFPSKQSYNFIQAGTDYQNLIEVIKKLDQVYLPGELIGQEAFFTILENTLRNVKHYVKVLEDIRTNGLNFCLSIQPVPFVRRDGTPTEEEKLFKVGVWLHHPQKLYFDNSGEAVIEQQMNILKERIVGPEGKVRLGGSNQDKVCSAMLMNNVFESVEEWDFRKVKKHYFPYILPASEAYSYLSERREGFIVQDDIYHITYNPSIRAESFFQDTPGIQAQQRHKKYVKAIKAYKSKVKETYPEHMGILKRYFHIWKGERIKQVQYNFEPQDDNLARFSIISCKEPKNPQNGQTFQNARNILRNKGVIRIVRENQRLKDISEAAKRKASQEIQDEYLEGVVVEWLSNWLPKDGGTKFNGIVLTKPEGKAHSPVGLVHLDPRSQTPKIVCHNLDEIRSLIEEGYLNKELLNENYHSLNLAHGVQYQDDIQQNGGFCRVRSHCSFMYYILRDNVSLSNLHEIEGSQVRGPKFLETILTQITFFDNRVFSMLPMSYEQKEVLDRYKKETEVPFTGHFDYLRKQLLLSTFPEEGHLFSSAPRL